MMSDISFNISQLRTLLRISRNKLGAKKLNLKNDEKFWWRLDNSKVW